MSSASRKRPAAALREAAIPAARSIDSASLRRRSRPISSASSRCCAEWQRVAQSRRPLDAGRSLDAARRGQPAAPAACASLPRMGRSRQRRRLSGPGRGDRLRRASRSGISCWWKRTLKKAAFLRAAIRETGANATVAAERIEAHASEDGRAAPMSCRRARSRRFPISCALAAPYLHEGSVMLLLKGQDFVHEHEAASKSWSFDVVSLPSATDPGGRVVAIRNPSPKADRP